MEYKCERRGKICYTKYPSKVKRFCSHKCANEQRWENVPKKVTTVTCEICGKQFTVSRSDARLKNKGVHFCSLSCRDIAMRTGSFANCKYCGKPFYSTRNEFCSKECVYAYRKDHGEHHPYFEKGYLVEYKNGYNVKGNAKQHRLIMEKEIGRRLGRDEVVHHKNGIKTDNRIENLQIMTRSEHSKYHRMIERQKREQEVTK